MITFSKNSRITSANGSSVSMFKAWIRSSSLSNLDGVSLFKIPRTALDISCKINKFKITSHVGQLNKESEKIPELSTIKNYTNYTVASLSATH